MSNFNASEYLENIINNKVEYNIDNPKLLNYLNLLSKKIEKQKGVYTILITLLLYKINFPKQDIRYHKKVLKNGFSGRTYDTKFVTPTLKKNSLPSMAASGYLTRSLEQPHPFDLSFPGKISDEEAKTCFLNIIDIFQSKPEYCRDILIFLINEGKKLRKQNYTIVKKIKAENKFSVDRIIKILKCYFYFKFGLSGGSKLPVISFYCLMKLIIKQNFKYKNMNLKKMGFHTTSDKTSKSAGDIEIFNKELCFEAYEIKFEHNIDNHLINIAYEKIKKFNPIRYFVLSTKFSRNNFEQKEIDKIKNEHGCEIIIGDYFEFLEKYLYTINSLEDFVNDFSKEISLDKELKIIHKKTWEKIIIENL